MSIALRLSAASCLIAICAQAALADGVGATQWHVQTSDPDRFSGTVTIADTGEARTLDYAFVYEGRIISMTATAAVMEPLGNDCWRAGVEGEFMADIAETMEVLFCQRGDRAFWSMLDDRGGAVRLPAWVSLRRSNDIATPEP